MAAGLSQEIVAEAVGISQKLLNSIENGGHQFNLETAQKLAGFLDMTLQIGPAASKMAKTLTKTEKYAEVEELLKERRLTVESAETLRQIIEEYE